MPEPGLPREPGCAADRGTSAGEERLRARPPLPSSLDELEPLDEAYDRAAAEALTRLGLRPAPSALAAIRAHVRLLLAWNASINLTAIRDPERVALLHVADSLSALPHIAGRLPARPSLLDIGSGTGFPGLALGLALPAGRIRLVDSVAKKARFLHVAAGIVRGVMASMGDEPPDVDVSAVRVEELCARPSEREAWDVVTARAVGPLAEVAELGLPLLRRGGLLLAWKRSGSDRELEAELQDAGPLVRAAGGGRAEVLAVDDGLLPGHRIVRITHLHPAPARYPRPPRTRSASRAHDA